MVAQNSGLLLYQLSLSSSLRVSSHLFVLGVVSCGFDLVCAKGSVTQALSSHNYATVCGMI